MYVIVEEESRNTPRRAVCNSIVFRHEDRQACKEFIFQKADKLRKHNSFRLWRKLFKLSHVVNVCMHHSSKLYWQEVRPTKEMIYFSWQLGNLDEKDHNKVNLIKYSHSKRAYIVCHIDVDEHFA